MTTGAVPNPPEPAPKPRRKPSTPPVPASLAAAAVLHHLTTADHRLTLGARDRATIAPLIDQWLANGATDSQIISAVTLGLPADLRCPAGLLTYRLKTKLPPPNPHPTASAATAATSATTPSSHPTTGPSPTHSHSEAAQLRWRGVKTRRQGGIRTPV